MSLVDASFSVPSSVSHEADNFSSSELQESHVNQAFPSIIDGPSAWDGKDMEQHPEKWIYHITPEDINDMDQGLRHFNSLSIPLIDISPETFPLGDFAHTICSFQKEFFRGKGFTLLRGFPIALYDPKDQIAIFMGIGTYIGTLKAQNAKGHGSTTKWVYNAEDPTTRIYATRKAQPFHVDEADVVGLLCLSEGTQGGLSSIISSHTLYNRLSELRPDIVALLKQSWLWDKKNEHLPGEKPYTAMSPIQFHHGNLFTFWGPHFFETVTRLPGVTVDPKKFEAMRYIQRLCEQEALNMKLQVGDIQLLQNYQILHARTAYKDEPGQTRHLLRLWLMVEEKEVRWKMPEGQEDVNYSYHSLAVPVVPLQAE
ncbi:hypothetical protein BDF14DRAFT_1873077 [Spinellus fusiger]|nr:hypothetical protein BDF14DRAFT_1873077 [Spinellus fusiger]